MCGIYLYKSIINNNAEEVVLSGLKNLEYRGYDSWGIASVDIENKLRLNKFVGKVSENNFVTMESTLALGHTRWATHGKVTEQNSHPHISNNQRYIVVHNGIFENYLEQKNILLKQSVKFYSETDTEVIANMLEQEPLAKVFRQVKGSNAFIVLDTKTNKVMLAKNGSPLHVGVNVAGDIFVSSDLNIILESSDKVYSLKDGEVVDLDKLNNLKFVKNAKIPLAHAKGGEAQDGLNTFAYFMQKEIFDQKSHSILAYEKNTPLGDNWYKNKNIFASGCGTAYHAALMFSNLAAKKGISVKVIPANECESVQNLIDKKTILFLFSQSGETADSIFFAKEVMRKGGKVYSVLNSENSTLSQISEKTFLIHSGKEVAVASTKAFTSMVLTSMSLLDYKIPKNSFKILDEYINYELFEHIKNIVKNFEEVKDLFVIGKGEENIVALETALKIKEISYIHAEGFAAGELKHGVLALIQEKVLSIVMNSNEKYNSDIENASLQIKARGGQVLGVGYENKDYFDYFIEIPKLKKDVDGFAIIFTTIVGQILGYEFALARGNNPDKPRNLAKSVTVK
jgi:glucosamine--fructose-6-phosphate aminotransferase (isomerizing)